MIACDCEVQADCLTSSTNITTSQRGVSVLGPLRDIRAACEHLEGGVLFQALKAGGECCQNYFVVYVFSFTVFFPQLHA